MDDAESDKIHDASLKAIQDGFDSENSAPSGNLVLVLTLAIGLLAFVTIAIMAWW